MKTLALITALLMPALTLHAYHMKKGQVLDIQNDMTSIKDPDFDFAPDWRVWRLVQIQDGWALFSWDWDGQESRTRVALPMNEIVVSRKGQLLISTPTKKGGLVGKIIFIKKYETNTQDGFNVFIYHFGVM